MMKSSESRGDLLASTIVFAAAWWGRRLKAHFEKSGYAVTSEQIKAFEHAIINCLIYDAKKGYKGVWLISDHLCVRLAVAANHAGIPEDYFPDHVHMRVSFQEGQVGVIDGYGAEYKTRYDFAVEGVYNEDE